MPLVMVGCGFKLRSAPPLPDNLDVIVTAQQPFMPLQLALVDRARIYGVNVVKTESEDESRMTLRIHLQNEAPERRLLSVFSTGQVAEYELIFPVRYRIVLPDGEEKFLSFEITRDYQDDPDQVLAKSRELDLVLKEMRIEAADIILRRLPLLLN